MGGRGYLIRKQLVCTIYLLPYISLLNDSPRLTSCLTLSYYNFNILNLITGLIKHILSISFAPTLTGKIHLLIRLIYSAMATSSSFTCFMTLPLELRSKIWKFASFQQRNVILGFDADSSHEATFNSPTSPPSILHISKESRAEGLRYYRCVNFSESWTNWPAALLSSHFYINWEVDRLCFISSPKVFPNSFLLHRWRPMYQNVAKHIREQCIQNGLKNMAWNVLNVKHISKEYWEAHLERMMKDTISLLPWNHQIEDLVVFDEEEAVYPLLSGKDIIAFDAVPMIENRGHYRLDDTHFDTTGGSNASKSNIVLENLGSLLIQLLDERAAEWWSEHEHLSRKERITAFSQGLEARKAVNRVRVAYNVEKVVG